MSTEEIRDQNVSANPEVQDQEDAVENTENVIAEKPELDPEDLPKLFEALLFVAGSPISIAKFCDIAKIDEGVAKTVLQVIKQDYDTRGSSIELIEVNEGFQFRTKEFFAPFIQDLKKTKPRRLSAAALETLAVIAYRQPVVKSDIEAIRGVDVAPTLKTLLDRRLVRIIGYQGSVGQPALYGTTDYFLELFGLNSLGQLPSLKDLKELNEEPGEGGQEVESDDEATSKVADVQNSETAAPAQGANG